MSSETNSPITSAVPSTTEVEALLQVQTPRAWWRRPLVLGGAAAVVLALGAGYALHLRNLANAAPSYVTEAAQTGNLTLTVSANGTLQPTRSVNIGSDL